MQECWDRKLFACPLPLNLRLLIIYFVNIEGKKRFDWLVREFQRTDVTLTEQFQLQ